MFVKPNYCCNCGDRVERLDWHLWNSKRFCELCETEYLFDEWWPRALVGIILVLGFTGIGFHYGGTNKPVIVTENTFRSASPQTEKKNGKKAALSPSELRPPASAATAPAVETAKPTPGNAERMTEIFPAIDNNAAEKEEDVFFCGAMTKKGTACARRVKGGGRCWQHKDKETQ